jgi:hypothetical protein
MALGYLPRIKHKSTTLCSALVSFSCISCVSWSFSFLPRERLRFLGFGLAIATLQRRVVPPQNAAPRRFALKGPQT